MDEGRRDGQEVKVAAIQMDCTLGDWEENMSKAERLVRQAAEQGARLAVLPELFNTGYSVAEMDYELSELVPGGKSTEWMEKISRQYDMYLVAALIERSDCDGVVYDTSVLTGPEGYIGKYRKVCLWGNESLRFRSGSNYPVFDLGFARLGMQICYEVGFPEEARILTLKGANLITYSAAFGQARSYAWELASRARALENGLYVVAANRWGTEKETLEFAGKSRIVDPRGEILAEQQEGDGVILAEICIDEVEKQRRTIPYLKDYKRELFSSELAGE